MKVQNIFALIVFGNSLTQLVNAVNDSIEDLQKRHIEESTTFDMPQGFRETKKVLFSAMVGGSSHVHWVVSILDELSSRGHNTSFITKTDHAKFTRDYPNIRTISLGERLVDDHASLMADFRKASMLELKVIMTGELVSLFKEDYFKMLKLMEEGQYDIAICDSFNTPCQEAAHKLNIPTVITSSMPQSDDSAAPYINNDMMDLDIPTTQFMSFWERVEVKLIRPLLFQWRTYSYHKKQNQILKSSGSDTLFRQESRWKDSVKMYNTAFGIQYGRPLGPLVELIGPIIKTKVAKLTPELKDYLNNHKHVAYIGFGQNAELDSNDIKLILIGLVEAYENGDIDGFIWSIRGFRERFPKSIITQSNKTYETKDLFDKNDDMLFLSWAPQIAILTHPSTSLNINHGGSASIYESLYAGLKMVVYPFFGDQRASIFNAEKRGYGLGATSDMTQEQVTEIIRTVARDEDKKFQKNAARYKALVQIRSKHGVIRGADLVEEVLFMNENGKITHRRDVKNDISFLKATNLDIYAFALVFASGTLYSLYYLICFLYSKHMITTSKIKQKAL